MDQEPMLIAVAPNGAKKTKTNHPEIPLSSVELIETAEKCLEAGASMMHFHVRDRHGKHSLDHAIYGPVLRDLEHAVGDRMLLQVSSESAGIYKSAEQIEQMKRLAPHCLSCGLKEIIGSNDDYDPGHAFFSELHRTGVLVQYILYSPAEVEWYETLCREGVIPGEEHFLLFVLGRYGQASGKEDELGEYVDSLRRKSPWMVCSFGLAEHKAVAQATLLGGHVRVGFENNHQLPDGSLAPDNGALVQLAANRAFSAGRSSGDKGFAESLYGARGN